MSNTGSVPEWFNIAALAERTGVPAHTLRKWEERYGAIRPARTSGGQRRYSDLDAARVEWLRDRLAEGYRIGEAASLLGIEGIPPPRTPDALREAIFEALVTGDPGTVDQLLDHAFAVYRLERTLADVVAPVFERVGNAWESGAVSVAHEHQLTAAVRTRFDRLLADARGGVRGRAVLACAPDERHDLGLLVVTAMMRADGWAAVYLGADTPVFDAVRIAERTRAQVLCLSLALADRIPALAAGVEAANVPPTLTLVLGGAGATAAVAARIGARMPARKLETALVELRELAA
jgi:MerR family transcriptional regulator, light-induced transcriptional regulator